MTQHYARESDFNHYQWLKDYNLTSLSNKSILDVGCGSGHLPELLSKQGARVTGIDIIPPSVLSENWRFIQTNLEDESWASELSNPNTFDVILAFDIIEHPTSPWKFLEQLRQLLSVDGALIITTPNTNSWERILRPSSWSGVRDPQHKVLFNRHSLTFLLKQAGFRITFYNSPIRKLQFLGPLAPRIGAQMVVKAEVLQK